jgi:hypothetical protein
MSTVPSCNSCGACCIVYVVQVLPDEIENVNVGLRKKRRRAWRAWKLSKRGRRSFLPRKSRFAWQTLPTSIGPTRSENPTRFWQKNKTS